MIETMRLLWAEAVGKDGKIKDHDKALAACNVAKDAAPYMHGRMQTIQAHIDKTISDHPSRDHNLAILEKLKAAGKASEKVH